MRTKFSIVVMFVFSILALAITASAQDAKEKAFNCDDYTVDENGKFVCITPEGVVVKGDLPQKEVPRPLSVNDLNKIIDARIQGAKANKAADLNSAVGEYFYSDEMKTVFEAAEVLRQKGLANDAEKLVRKSIGKDPYLRDAWEAYKKGKRQTATRVRNLNNMLGETQLTGCTASTIPSFIDKSVADAFWFNVRVVFVTQNLTDGKVRVRDEKGKIVVNGFCPGGVMNLHRHLETFTDGTRASFRFIAEVERPDGTLYLTESPSVTLDSYWINDGRQQTVIWKIQDPEKGQHPAPVKVDEVEPETDDLADMPEEPTPAERQVDKLNPRFEEQRVQERQPAQTGPALVVPEIMMPVMPR